MPQINTISVSAKVAFVHELRKQFAYAGHPLVIDPADIRPDRFDAWRARVQVKVKRNTTRAVLITSHETVAQCLRGFSVEWVTQTHVVIHGQKVDGQLTVG